MKKTLKKALALLLVLSMGVIVFGCQKTTVTQTPTGTVVPPVKIAILWNVTGSGADSGQQEVWGSQLAAKQINDAGGIKSLGGAKIQLVIGDTMSDVNQAKAVADRVLADNDIIAVSAASGSAYLIPMLPTFDKLQVPVVCINISDSITAKGYQYVFQTYSKGTQFGALQISFLDYLQSTYGLSLTKIGILYENTDYGISTSKGSRDLINASGGKYQVVFDQAFPLGLTDASSLVTALKNSGAQVLLPVAFSQDAKLIYDTMKSMSYNPLSIGGGAGFLFPAFAKAMGDSVDGFVSTSMCNWDSSAVMADPALSGMPAAYEKAYGQFPTEHSIATYNNIYVIAQALEKSGSRDRTALRDALRNLNIKSMSQTPTGFTKFDSTGWNPSEPVLVQWQKSADGIYRTVTVYPEKYRSNGVFKLPPALAALATKK